MKKEITAKFTEQEAFLIKLGLQAFTEGRIYGNHNSWSVDLERVHSILRKLEDKQ